MREGQMKTKQLACRVPEDLTDEIEKRKIGDITQTDIVIAALRLYFTPQDNVMQCNAIEIQRLTDEMQKLKSVMQSNSEVIREKEHNIIRLSELISEKDKRIKVLENNIGFLQLEFSKLDPVLTALMPSKEEIRKKKWWHFW